MDKNFKNLSSVVSQAILYDRNGIISLLENNGVIIFDSDHIKSEKLVTIIFKNLENVKFQDVFLNYIKEKFQFSNADGFFSGFNASAITGLVSSGLSFLGNSSASKDQKSIAEINAQAAITSAQSQAQIAATQLQIAQLNLEASKAPKTDNTKLYVGIGIASVVVVGLLIFAIKK